MKYNQKIILGVTLSTFAFLITNYAITEYYKIKTENNRIEEYNNFIQSNDSFYPGTYINNIDVSDMTIAEVISLFEDNIVNRTIKIRTELDNSSAIFDLRYLNMNFTGFENEITNIFNNQEISYEEYFSTEEPKHSIYTYNIYDGLVYENIDFSSVSFLQEENIVDSSDAFITVDVKNSSVLIEDEIYGNRLKDGVFQNKLIYAINNNISEIVFKEEDYIKPQILSTDESIETEREYYEAVFNKSISLTVCGIIVDLNKDDTRNFYIFNDDNSVSLNEKEINQFISSLKSSYDTYGKPRTFHTSTGTDVVLDNNLYGWEINSKDTYKEIEKALQSSNERESISAHYIHTGQRYVLNEISNTYIEVSIDNQHMWMYKNGECILSSVCITGELTNPDMWTHKGVYYLINTATDCVLKGPDYRYDVSYWIFFDRENAIGFHDATWRDPSEFTETTYNGNGSHGCINLPLDVVASLYNNLSMDEPVIIW